MTERNLVYGAFAALFFLGLAATITHLIVLGVICIALLGLLALNFYGVI